MRVQNVCVRMMCIDAIQEAASRVRTYAKNAIRISEFIAYAVSNLFACDCNALPRSLFRSPLQAADRRYPVRSEHRTAINPGRAIVSAHWGWRGYMIYIIHIIGERT